MSESVDNFLSDEKSDSGAGDEESDLHTAFKVELEVMVQVQVTRMACDSLGDVGVGVGVKRQTLNTNNLLTPK